MDNLFGAPMSTVAAVLAVAFGIAVAFLIYVRVRNRILVRMAFRNVLRRPGQSLLIISGLMLATAIISSSFTVGDSVTYSIKKNAAESIRSLDELVVVDDDSEVWKGGAPPDGFSETVFQELAPALDADPDVDGALPSLSQHVSVINPNSQQFDSSVLLAGLDPQRATAFEELFDTEGAPVDLAVLGPGEVYITKDGAESLLVEPGGVLNVALGPGMFTPITVRGVADGSYVSAQGADVVLLATLSSVQEMLGRPDELSGILISNRGDVFSGIDLTDTVMERYQDHPAVGGKGLELVPVKRNVVDAANEFGSLFVSVFTTFGLFSIGVGLLLIFLIFSMLAAERKSEMGMSRAVGMQRQHLVRIFTVEGAIYGIGSAIVGAVIGVGLGLILVVAVSSIISQTVEEFSFTPHVQPVSFLSSFLAGSVLTFITVFLSARRISRLNIVRAIRDLPESQIKGSRRGPLIRAAGLTLFGVLVLVTAFQAAHLPFFGLGLSIIVLGISMGVRAYGVPQRWVFTGAGLFLVVYWLIPHSYLKSLKPDFTEDMSGFFLVGSFLVTGAVLVTVNNAPIVLGLMSNTIGRVRRYSPVVKSAVSYPLQSRSRTGLSLAMFAIIIFSVTVMATFVDVFDNLLNNEDRIVGGYEVIGFVRTDLNPIDDLRAAVDDKQELAFIERVDGVPSVGTFHTVYQADARLASDSSGDYANTTVTGIGDDFFETNRFGIALTVPEYTGGDGPDSAAVWEAVQANPGLAIVSATIVPTRSNSAFALPSEQFTLNDVEDLLVENEHMDPVHISVRDQEGGNTLELKVIGVLDTLASNGPIPVGFYVSPETLGRDVGATQFFFNIDEGADDADAAIEAAFFQNGVETLEVKEFIAEGQAAQKALFNLLIGFMSLGLLVGIAALGVISARTVVERRHAIGVLRAIGFSPGMVQLSFIAEMSFLAILGIGMGLGLGLISSVELIDELRLDEPEVEFVLPWMKVVLISIGAYIFSLLTTILPARQAAAIAPAEALRYE